MVVVAKDSDFLDFHFIKWIPRRLLIVATDNINYKDLIALFTASIEVIKDLFEKFNVIELCRDSIIVDESESLR